ncbi:NAD(P)H-dependent oxidoreductase [Clostridium sp. WILCCON 0269]|uniref:NAD(P)H-dependent oxidoreductase n=1 Tax=Candidatus Clostridium eludens TaxID=3381663 RepID=A0ABW8SSB3_9CLOT
MRILIVSDSSTKNNVGQNLENELINKLKDSTYSYKHYNVKDAEIKQCIGCFNCWLKTPGICIFNDVTRHICKNEVNSDVYIILSEVKYGGASPQIKRVLDRSICKILPFFKCINGELHHAPRYEKYPEYIYVGYGSDISIDEEETFRKLSQANAINFQKDKMEVHLCRKSEEIEDLVADIFRFIKQKEVAV